VIPLVYLTITEREGELERDDRLKVNQP